MSDIVENLPRLTVLGIAIVAVGWAITSFVVGKSSQSGLLPDKSEWAEEDLKEFDGSDSSKPILMGINGKVYDVSKGREYYGKDGGYRNLAGRDATRLLAKNLLDPKKDNKEPLNEAELKQMQQWESFFENKYSVVGALKKNKND